MWLSLLTCSSIYKLELEAALAGFFNSDKIRYSHAKLLLELFKNISGCYGLITENIVSRENCCWMIMAMRFFVLMALIDHKLDSFTLLIELVKTAERCPLIVE